MERRAGKGEARGVTIAHLMKRVARSSQRQGNASTRAGLPDQRVGGAGRGESMRRLALSPRSRSMFKRLWKSSARFAES
jgi:hypothetical protein